ncbi:thioredoxin domain-containing protein [bacterium]|nr:thioredoxin domain-containing protein [bacterium]
MRILIIIILISLLFGCSSTRVNEQTIYDKDSSQLLFVFQKNNTIYLSKTDTKKEIQKLVFVSDINEDIKNLYLNIDGKKLNISWIENNRKIDKNFDLDEIDSIRFFDDKNLIAKIGNPKADVVIELFSDYLCPACKTLDENLFEAISSFNNVLLIRYEFPLDGECNKLLFYQKMMGKNLHNNACSAASTAICGKNSYWKIHDELYHNQKDITGVFVEDMAKKYNIDKECIYEGGVGFESIRKTINEKLKEYKNINKTPYYIINKTEHLSGSKSVDELKEILRKAGAK